MNARNLRVEVENLPKAIRLVDDKLSTKAALQSAGVPVAPTLAVVRQRWELGGFDWGALPDAWALKPNNGRRGAGILLATERDGDGGWRTGSGKRLSRSRIKGHLRYVLDGDYSMEGVQRDSALFEPLIHPHPELAALIPSGLPDVRVICHYGEPLLAMVRLPTLKSGKANLHQGALGATVDLESGCISRAQIEGREVFEHPDTKHVLVGARIPHWDGVVAAATACHAATGLGYLGADVVIDWDRGPLVLEVNARPGLEIQNVTGVGLAGLL